MARRRLGPKTRAYARSLLKFRSVTRMALSSLERFPGLRSRVRALRAAGNTVAESAAAIEQMEALGRVSAGVRAAAEDQLAAASLELSAAQAEAATAWERGAEQPPPLRWLLRRLAEGQQLQAQVADVQERSARALAAALARLDELE